VAAERALLHALDGSCRTAIGAFSRINGDQLALKGEILSPDGTTSIEGTLAGPAAAPAALGHELGQILRDKAGSEFFKLFPA
jgi:hydroxymethylbilane synthase